LLKPRGSRAISHRAQRAGRKWITFGAAPAAGATILRAAARVPERSPVGRRAAPGDSWTRRNASARVRRHVRPDVFLHRNSPRFFAVFLLLVLWAFWPSYFTRLFAQPNVRFHLHGVAFTLWCVMLVLQAQLIRTQRRALHKRIGKLSYVLAPAVIAITISFVHYRVAGAVPSPERLPGFVLYFLALTLNSMVGFALFYGLAIYHRRDSLRHARWMVSTVFPLFTPATDRLIGAHAPSLAALVPRIDGNPILPVAGFVLADLMLVGLALWDWRANKRADVFPIALLAMLVYHASVLTLHRVPAWHAFCAWFLSLPLS
jgi:hypothetical protein